MYRLPPTSWKALKLKLYHRCLGVFYIYTCSLMCQSFKLWFLHGKYKVQIDCSTDGIFIKHRQGKSSDAETPFTRPRPIAETTFTPPRPIAQHPFFLQEIDRGDSFSNLRDRPRRLLFQHGSVISRNWSASEAQGKFKDKVDWVHQRLKQRKLNTFQRERKRIELY